MPFTSDTAAAAGSKSKRGPSKLNREAKAKLESILHGAIENDLENDLRLMPAKERWDILTKLAEFAWPKLARSQVELDTPDGRIVFENVSKHNIPKSEDDGS